ncbi:DUF2157 domain-containing protein [Chitinilyticum litopenaei]|uniref:DUF2157 domain-containing protein n=1 Tax=Chitinilyticum litopenaei TaxID=1121276 RepID=UPI00068683A6|nr:DUF2157 domain-containing protein [Chitinilyticum litopenaei]
MQASDVTAAEQAVLAGQLSQDDYLAAARAAGELPDLAGWRRWLWRTPAVGGLLCVLAGIIMVFAANWWTWPALARVALAQGVWLLAVLAWFVLRQRPAGAWAALAVVVLTGAWLAVIGQTYQTGADAWELFAAWALLALPWTLWARHEPLWGFWLLLASTAIILFNNQTAGWQAYWPQAGLWPLLLLWLAACWYLVFRAGQPGPFAHGVLLVASFVLAIPAWAAVLDWRGDAVPLRAWLAIHPGLSILFWLGLNVAALWRFRQRAPLLWLACPAYSLWVGGLIALGRALDSRGGLLLLALLAVGSFAGLGYWLRMTGRREPHHD